MKSHGKVQRHALFPATIAGPMFLVSAAFLFTFSNVLIKLFGPQYSAWHIAFYRFFGGTIFLLTILGRHSNPFSGNNTRVLMLRGCLGAVNFIFFITAIRLLPVSTALVIIFSFPAFAAVFSRVIYNERIRLSQMICIAIAITGIGVLLDFRMSGNSFGYIAALATSAIAGLNITFIRELRKNNGPVIIYFYVCIIGALVTLPKFIMAPLIPQTASGWAMIMALIVFAGAGQILMNQGFYYCRSSEGGVLMSSEAILTVAAGIMFLGDTVTWRFFIGGMMVLVSSVMLIRLKAPTDEAG